MKGAQLIRRATFIAVMFLLLSAEGSYASELLFAVSEQSKVAQPKVVHTEIFAISVENGQRRLIFSDENLPILLIPPHSSRMLDVMVSAHGRVFARGMERAQYPGGYFEGSNRFGPYVPVFIYELSTDGSNKYRKVLEIRGDQHLNSNRRMFVSRDASRVGYVNMIEEKTYIFIHNATTGELIRRIDPVKLLQGCFIFDIGFLNDNQSLYLQLDSVGEGSACDEKLLNGNYTMSADGSSTTRFPADLIGTSRQLPMIPEPLGQLPDESYLFKTYLWRPGAQGNIAVALVSVDKAWHSRTEIPITTRAENSVSLLSPSGKFLAFTDEDHKTKSATLIVKYLSTREEHKVFSFSFTLGGAVDFRLQGPIGWLEQ